MSCPIEGGKALVVGGAGFVGSNLVKQLLDLGASEVLVVDNLLSAEKENLPDDERVSFVEGSIADDKVSRTCPPTASGSGTSPPTTATSPRSRTRSPTTTTT